jgi:hypothetical protein
MLKKVYLEKTKFYPLIYINTMWIVGEMSKLRERGMTCKFMDLCPNPKILYHEKTKTLKGVLICPS